MKNFVAIDFETAQPARHTACSIGIVKMSDGVIVQKFNSLIKPPGNIFSEHNVNVHHINSIHTENAPEFLSVYPFIKALLNNAHVVCHNASFDIDVLYKTMEFNGIDSSDLKFEVSDTLQIFGKGLKDCCSECGIELNHHDSLSDAEACAKLFLRVNNVEFKDLKPGKSKVAHDMYAGHQRITGQILKPELDSVEDKTNPFFGKKVVISGTYERWPDRTELARIIQKLGADIDASVGPHTQILIAGAGVGPKKLEKMHSNIKAGKDCIIITEANVAQMLGL